LINKATLGELIGILSTIDKRSRSLESTKTVLKRSNLIPKGNKTLNLLNDMNHLRKFFVHDSEGPSDEPTKGTLQQVIEIAGQLIHELQATYPIPVIASRLETTGYKTTYLIVKDEEGTDYKVYLDEYLSEDIFKNVYLMARIESHIVVNPILVKRL
jgi:hypothetical protein